MRKIFVFGFLIFGLFLAACGREEPAPQPYGQIHLYGERHGDPRHLDLQFQRWYYFYHSHNMRHLFAELPFFTAEFLNIWMNEEDDEILDALFRDFRGTSLYDPYVRAFLNRIKDEMPETIFHGYDIGHQHDTIGPRFLRHLRDNGLEGSEKYHMTRENIRQGRTHHSERVNFMVENFVRQFNALDGENIMTAFAGAAHVALGTYPWNDVTTFASQLIEIFGEDVHRTLLTAIPVKTEILIVEGREYEASFFGKQDVSGRSDLFVSREFWRLENAYEDFRNHPTGDEVVPFHGFIMPVEVGQVIATRATLHDGSTKMWFGRASDGVLWQGREAVQEFVVED